MRLFGPVSPGADALQILFQAFQAVQLFQPKGRSAWGVFGPGAEPIPTPQVTFEANQPLAWFQRRLRGISGIGIHQSDLIDPAAQYVRDIHMQRQRDNPSRQRPVAVVF